LALNDDLFVHAQKREEDVNINVGIRQVADVDACGTDLRCVVPENVTIAGIAAR
jgi:hypothetical protein